MRQERLQVLMPGDRAWIQCEITGKAEGNSILARLPNSGTEHWVPCGLIELELPTPSIPEGYEEFWPESIASVTTFDRVGHLRVNGYKGNELSFLTHKSDAKYFYAHADFDVLKALGVPFYRPIKKEPEEYTCIIGGFKDATGTFITVAGLPIHLIGKRVKVVPCE